jgi:hypothetical protein
MRFEVFTAMKMSVVVFWVVVMPCSLLDDNQSFGGTFRLHVQGR